MLMKHDVIIILQNSKAVENIYLERMADNVQLQSTTSLEHRNGDERSGMF